MCHSKEVEEEVREKRGVGGWGWGREREKERKKERERERERERKRERERLWNLRDREVGGSMKAYHGLYPFSEPCHLKDIPYKQANSNQQTNQASNH